MSSRISVSSRKEGANGCSASRPPPLHRLQECVFDGCSSQGHGGALFLESVAAQIGVIGTTIADCTVVANRATQRGGAIGAADASEPVITGCRFEANRAGMGGGAISADQRVTVTVQDCVFDANDGGSGRADIDTDHLSMVVRQNGA